MARLTVQLTLFCVFRPWDRNACIRFWPPNEAQHSKIEWTFGGLAQENGFGSVWLCRLLWQVNGPAALCTCRKCNKYEITIAHCLWLAHHNHWSRWFASSSPSPICCPSFSSMSGCKRVHNQTWMWKIFSDHILSTAGDALRMLF